MKFELEEAILKLDQSFPMSVREYRRTKGCRLTGSELKFFVDFSQDIHLILKGVKSTLELKAMTLVEVIPYTLDFWDCFGYQIEKRYCRWLRKSLSSFLELDGGRVLSKQDCRIIYDIICDEHDGSLLLAQEFIRGGYRANYLENKRGMVHHHNLIKEEV